MTAWREVLRSTPMRLTIRLVVVFALVSVAAFAATWWLTNKALLDATETSLKQKIEDLASSRDPMIIARAVADAASRADGEHLILRYDGPNGPVGNYLGPLPEGKLREADLRDKSHDVHGRYLLKTKKVAGGLLTAGQEADAFRELREMFLSVLMFTLLPTVVLAGGAGFWLARRSAHRLAAIDDALSRLTAGDLTTRLPALPGPPDDLTRVGAGIDKLASAQEASVSALKQVSADIAHDLKTPIQRLSVLLEQAREQAPDLGALEQAKVEVDGIVATFHALLRIAQIEGGGPRARFVPVDLGTLGKTIAELYEPAAEESGHALTLTLTDPATIRGDRTLLGQVFANLIENALRHSPAGPVELKVDRATITVADRGPGIPAEEREAVLRRLYRLDQSRSTPGNGLGLSLVDAIVKLHGGRLELTDNSPGLKVTVQLAS